ncbi:response regulator transcription factor [Rurimicrobium arvi]|uniref:Two-component system response regulator DegU n=1 Tax=Rurimicrobium arvi TaxID=2049916 RepID=A0ABP8N2A6_9BACT
MQQMIKVGLVEDQILFREGIKAILGNWQDISVVFESADGYSVPGKLEQCAELPDVMLVDLSLPSSGHTEYNGRQLTEYLIRVYPAMKVIILSVHDDENFINQLIECGAHAYLVKDTDPYEVYDAIVSVFHRGSYINERTLNAIRRNMGKKHTAKRPLTTITRREEEVLKLVCQQHTAEEIAQILFLSVKTVNGHRNALLQKTGSRNVTGLVLFAIRHHIIAPV